MGIIINVNELTFEQNSLCYEGKKIGRWWGKTLYYFDPTKKELHYENFSLIGRILHLFGYKKKFGNEGLNEWLVTKNISLAKLTKNNKVTEAVVIQGLKILQDQKRQFEFLCFRGVDSPKII